MEPSEDINKIFDNILQQLSKAREEIDRSVYAKLVDSQYNVARTAAEIQKLKIEKKFVW